VDRAPTAITALYPASVSANSSVSLAAQVVAKPALPQGADAPTGNVEILNSTGSVLCEFDLANSGNGTGTCPAIFSTPGTNNITTYYSGDSNYQPSQIVSTISVCGADDLACKLPGKWLESFDWNVWTINADGVTGTFEIFDSEPSPCYNIPLPATVQLLEGDSFVATAVLPGNGFPCQTTWVDALTLDSSGLTAQGTFATGINHGATSWTKASGPVVIVPNLLGLDQTFAQTVLARASLTLGSVTLQVATEPGEYGVVSETPAAGSAVASGSAVNLVIWTAPSN
jgi:hypothetical protein